LEAVQVAGIDWSAGGEAPFRRIGMSATTNQVSLTQQGAIAGTLRVNLRWNPSAGGGNRAGRRGLLAARRADPAGSDTARSVDLDLGCLYEFTDGQRGVVQAVGRRSGDYARAPFIRLDRDDRIGSSTGENIFINMDQSAHFARILIFAMVAGGTDDLTRTGASVTIYPTAGPALEFRLESATTPTVTRTRSCAVAQIRRQGTEIVVHRELRYFPGYQSEIDRAYNWGLRWAPGGAKAWL
jgi:tellurite resistance protein TerA